MPAGYDPGRVHGKAAREKRRPPKRGGPGRIRSSILPGPRIATGSAPDKAHPGRKREGRPRGTARVPYERYEVPAPDSRMVNARQGRLGGGLLDSREGTVSLAERLLLRP